MKLILKHLNSYINCTIKYYYGLSSNINVKSIIPTDNSINISEPHVGANLAKFVNSNITLQNLIKIGVDISQFDKLKNIPEYLIKADFDRDIKKYLLFLLQLNIPSNMIHNVITKNPFLFLEDTDNLHVRINYLRWKKFSHNDITYLVIKYPKILSISTLELDSRLGNIQKLFGLSSKDIRLSFLSSPKIIDYNFQLLKLTSMTMIKELNFSKQEIKSIFQEYPLTLMTDRTNLIKRYDYLTNDMGIKRELIVKWPNILTSRSKIIKYRHLFLKYLEKIQYDETKPLYISMKALVSGTDEEFCVQVAKMSVEKYYEFLKTL
ncbi:unnamed protein product [Gordionus sp. m RMFG-2023]|uniref:transcription termination factor 3, mitochondrial-like n=1 Tax=Gordionus sp. m RMFG-2023 TaxID=3053472 RepID=UPI0030E0FE2A